MSSLWPIKVSSRTDIGCGREHNEDSFIEWRLKPRSTAAPHDGAMLAVADGIGGHNHGEVASRMVCELLAAQIRELGGKPQTTKSFCTSMENIFRDINDAVISEGERNPIYQGMGTTLTSLVLFAKYCLIAHVGDCRVHRLRDGEFTQLTPDHTMVQSMLEKGILNEEQAAVHPYRNILTAAMGKDPELAQIYTHIEVMAPGDKYLICSDGLHGFVSTDKLASALDYSQSPDMVCDRLVSEALKLETTDNVTVVSSFIE